MAPSTERRNVESRKSARATNNRNLIGSDSSLISLSLFLEQLDLFSNTKEVLRQKGKKLTVKKKSFVMSTAPGTILCHSTLLVKNSSDAVPNISTNRKNAFNESTNTKILRSSRNCAPFNPEQRKTISTNTLGSTKLAQNLFLNSRQNDMDYDKPLYENFQRTFMPEAMNSEHNSPKSPPQTAIIHNIVDALMHHLDNEDENQELNLSGPKTETDSDVDNNSSDLSDLLKEVSINHNTFNRRLSSHYLNSNKFCYPNKNGVEMFQWASERCDLKPSGDKIRLNEVLSNSVLKSGFIEFDIGGKKNATISKLHNIKFLVITGCAEVDVHICTNVFLRGQAFYVPKGVIYAITNIGEEKLLVEYVKILAKN